MGVQAVAEAIGVNRVTLWRWMKDDATFRAVREEIAHAIVAGAVQDLRNLTAEAIDALRDGLAADTRYTVHEGEVVGMPDRSLAVKTADLVLKRVPEFAEQRQVSLAGSVLLEWMDELDADDGAGA